MRRDSLFDLGITFLGLGLVPLNASFNLILSTDLSWSEKERVLPSRS